MRHYLHPWVVAAVLTVAACGDRADVASGPKPAAPAAAPASAAELAEGITFAKARYPDFVAKTTGVSQPEPFGRWTDGPKAEIEFKAPLPKKFELLVQGAAFGPNIGAPIRVTIGTVTQEISFPADLTQEPQTRRVPFNLGEPASRIAFAIPQPTRPTNGDLRALGIALVSLKIETAPN